MRRNLLMKNAHVYKAVHGGAKATGISLNIGGEGDEMYTF
jgi:hypothetical protein